MQIKKFKKINEMMNLENDLEYFKIMIDMAKDEEHCGDWCSVSQHIRPYLDDLYIFLESYKEYSLDELVDCILYDHIEESDVNPGDGYRFEFHEFEKGSLEDENWISINELFNNEGEEE